MKNTLLYQNIKVKISQSMTKPIVDVQQVEKHGANHCSGERTGAQTPDVSDYLTKGLLQSTVQIGTKNERYQMWRITTRINNMDPGHTKFVLGGMK